MSWKVIVIADRSGKWSSNQLRFATEGEAKAYGSDLAQRWSLVEKWQAIETVEPATHQWTGEGVQKVLV